MKFINWIINLFKKSNSSKEPNSSIIVKPVEPLPEVPTREEVDNFPHREIPDFFFADISHWIEKFDPKKYTGKILFHKTTQGLTNVDGRFLERKKQCLENNIIFSGYHFFECYKSAIGQANHFIKNHGSFSTLPIFDFESIPEKEGMEFKDLKADQENAYKCLKEIQRLTGKTPIVYANRLEIENLKLPAKWGEFYWWFSRYNSFLGDIPAPVKPEKVLGWQYKEVGKNYTTYPSTFEGIGNCDGNIYFGKNNILKL